MTLSLVAADEAVSADLMNQLIRNVNSSPGRAIFTSNGTWSVPEGVHRFKVTMCGGGGGSAYSNIGGISPQASVICSGFDIGTSFVIEIGAGGAMSPNPEVFDEGQPGGTSKFGTVFEISGGAGGPSQTRGTVTLGAGAVNLLYYNGLIVNNSGKVFGDTGGSSPPTDGRQGICIIEW